MASELPLLQAADRQVDAWLDQLEAYNRDRHDQATQLGLSRQGDGRSITRSLAHGHATGYEPITMPVVLPTCG